MTLAPRLLIPIVALLVASNAQAITGTEYRALTEASRQAWVVGAVDGILTTHLSQTGKEPGLSKCLVGLHPTQIKAIFEKALEVYPELWHFPAGFQLLDTLQEFCSIRK